MNSFFETGKKKPSGKRRRGFVSRASRALFNLTLLGVAAAVVGAGGLYLFATHEHGDELEPRYPRLAQTSYVYDADGERIGAFGAGEDRETVGAADLGHFPPKAVVAVEDRRFYNHLGVDAEGLARAAWTDLRAWEVQEGGSTITEQLMKNLFVPEEERVEVDFWRRFVQSALAFSYERGHTKGEILTAYLNTVYFGQGAYGIEAAAKTYFGKTAEQLSLSESAALAGFLHAPSTYSSVRGEVDEARARERRDEVLRLMRSQGWISPREKERAEAAGLRFAPPPPPGDPDHDPFLEKVRREVEQELGKDALALGGLRIRTTLDPGKQREAVEATEDVLYREDDPSAAVVTVEPQTGAILALAGQAGDFNLALDARRQPGSSFKPVVLAAALEKGWSPESVYVSQESAVAFRGREFEVNNYGGFERGEISLYEAMAESDNSVFVRLASDLGMGKVVRTAEDLGVKAPVEPLPATSIGGLGVGVSPLDMASAYATFAGGGIYREPYAVERVVRVSYGRRETVFDHRLVGRRVMSGNEAAAVTEVLRGVVLDGTASRYHDLDSELGLVSAGKTGTTDEYADAWYVGYTPRLSTAVWVGYPEGNRTMSGIRATEVGGETLPLDIWAAYMQKATAEEPALAFREPDLSEFEARYGGYGGSSGFSGS